MRKFITLLLTVVMCISFTACGTEKEIEEESSDQMQDSVCSIQIKINPQFEIFLNNEYAIVQIDYLNDDAQQAFFNINVLSLPFDEGVLKLLDALYAKGYAKNNSMHITWAVHVAEDSAFDPSVVVNDFERIVNDYSCKNEITISASMVDFNDNSLENGQQADDNYIASGDDWELLDNITIERDANGNITGYIETDSNGSKFTYNANKQKIHALIYHETGYSEKYYDENGQITKHIVIENDGSQTEFFYYLSGSKKQVYTMFANGEFKDEYYGEDGKRIKLIERRNTSGSSYVIDYDTDGNGNTDYQYAYAADGTVWYNEFDSNGNQIPNSQKQIQ